MTRPRSTVLTIAALLGSLGCARDHSSDNPLQLFHDYCDQTAQSAKRAQALGAVLQDFLRTPAGDERRAGTLLAERLPSLEPDCGASLLARHLSRRFKSTVREEMVEITIACERASFARELLVAELDRLRTDDAVPAGSCTPAERTRQAARVLDGTLTARHAGLVDTIARTTEQMRSRFRDPP
jgi:hypothetical protein